jgi:hypothetical protein
MRKLVLGVLVAGLCGVAGVSRAETPSAPRPVAPPAQRDAQARPAPDGDARRAEAEESDYAAREKAAPQLAEFSGGANGVYIGTGALVVALLVVLLLTTL